MSELTDQLADQNEVSKTRYCYLKSQPNFWLGGNIFKYTVETPLIETKGARRISDNRNFD